jgi:hypothetical protein
METEASNSSYPGLPGEDHSKEFPPYLAEMSSFEIAPRCRTAVSPERGRSRWVKIGRLTISVREIET